MKATEKQIAALIKFGVRAELATAANKDQAAAWMDDLLAAVSHDRFTKSDAEVAKALRKINGEPKAVGTMLPESAIDAAEFVGRMGGAECLRPIAELVEGSSPEVDAAYATGDWVLAVKTAAFQQRDTAPAIRERIEEQWTEFCRHGKVS